MSTTPDKITVTADRFDDGDPIPGEYIVKLNGERIGKVRRHDRVSPGYWGRWTAHGTGLGRYGHGDDTRKGAVAALVAAHKRTQALTDEAQARRPQPGDVVRLDGEYTGTKPGARAVIDGSHYGLTFDDGKGEHCLAVFSASAFRDDSKVSVSGGPCPLIPLSELVYVGTTEQRFWRWKDRPRAGGGVEYTDTVALWAWAGRR